MSNIDWKSKYQELKARYMQDVDTAFRLGFEQGKQKAEVDSVLQAQQQQAEEMQQQQQMGGEQGDDNSDPSQEVEAEAPADSQHPAGSELDQHINQLESMVQKGEMSMDDLAKAISGFKDFQKNVKFQSELKKSADAIPGIVKALHTPKFKLSQNANHNMKTNAKEAVSMQHKIVTDVLKSWNEEESRTSKKIVDQLKIEGLIAPKKD